MKKFILIIIIVFFIQLNGSTQSCLPQGIEFNTQSAIDSFPINYPGCTEIEGDVKIKGIGISNLNGLSGLYTIDGNLIIETNPDLLSLMGLSALTSIGKDLYIADNYSLSNLSGLDSLTSIGEDLLLYFNGLTSLNGLGPITYIPGHLKIYGTDSIKNLNGLGSIVSIGGQFSIISNASLINLSGLNSLKDTIGGGLVISQNTSLTNLSGLEDITYLGGLFISSNSVLTSLSALNAVTHTTSISIIDNPSLKSLTGLEGLTSIELFIGIITNDSLLSLSGLNSVTSIGHQIRIENNKSLLSLNGLDNIDHKTITDLYVLNNASLSFCAVKSVCDYLISPNGVDSIYNNAGGCNSCTEVINMCSSIFSVSGKVTYDDTLTPNQVINNLLLLLYQLNGNVIDSTLTDQNGNYQFNYVSSGTYYIQPVCTKPWGGGNTADALLIMKHFVDLQPLSYLKKKAADINGSGYINAMDALYVAQRFVMMINSFPSGDWVFEKDTITINGANVVHNFKGLCIGDVNGSYIVP